MDLSNILKKFFQSKSVFYECFLVIRMKIQSPFMSNNPKNMFFCHLDNMRTFMQINDVLINTLSVASHFLFFGLTVAFSCLLNICNMYAPILVTVT